MAQAGSPPIAIYSISGPCTLAQLKLGDFLANASIKMYDVFNHKDINDPILDYLAVDFATSTEHPDPGCRNTYTRQSHLENYAKMLQDSPNFYCKILDCTVNLENCNRRASIWLTAAFGGVEAGDIEKENICVMKWERRTHGGWVCYRNQTIKGPGTIL